MSGPTIAARDLSWWYLREQERGRFLPIRDRVWHRHLPRWLLHVCELREPCFRNPRLLRCHHRPGRAVSSRSNKGGFPGIVCVSVTGPCETSADCCADLECTNNVCG